MFDKVYLGAIVGLVLIASLLYAKVQTQNARLVQIEIELSNAKSQVEMKNLELDNSKDAQKSLEATLEKERIAADQLEKELEIIKNEPESDNGDVSPLLRRSLERLHEDNR